MQTREIFEEHFNSQLEMYFDQPLGLYTHTKTGGPADVVAFPTSKEQVQALVQIANDNQVPVTVIGNASNLIIRDGGIRGLVIILTKMTDVKVSQNEITACAGGAAIIEVTKVAQGAA